MGPILLTLALLAPAPAYAARQDAGPPDGDSEAAPAVIETAEALHLRDGSIHWGAIREHDADGIDFQRLDTGGMVRVRWELLDPVQTDDLKKRFGYVQVSAEELRIDADLLELDGGEEVIGRIVSREGSDYLVKTGGNLQLIPKARVTGIQSGLSVPALDVFTREEIYAQYLEQASPDSAADQYALAETCEKILDYAHALEHYLAAKTLDPTFKKDEIDATLERVGVSAAQQEQIDYLRDIDTLRKKGLYDDAVEHAMAFATKWPGSPLIPRAKGIETQLQEARWSAIVEFVRKRWYERILQLAHKAALDKTYEQAVAYAQEEMGQELRKLVLEDCQKKFSKKIDLAQIEQAWKSRRKGRFNPASYGVGTWLLGEDAALKGKEEEKEKAPTTEKDAERVKLEEKIKRFLANQEQQRKAKNRAEEAEDFEAFWAAFSIGGRSQWIQAYYAEYGGDVEVGAKPFFEFCRDCGGTGVREVIYLGGTEGSQSGTTIQRCQRCMGLGVVRKVRYR
jgi:hypothetical protein